MGRSHFEIHKNTILQTRDRIRELEQTLSAEKSTIKKSIRYFSMRKYHGLATKSPLKRNGYDVNGIEYTGYYSESRREKRMKQIYAWIVKGYKVETICRKANIKRSTFDSYVRDLNRIVKLRDSVAE